MAEDYDAWLRVALKWEADFCPEPLCSYRVHETNTTSVQDERNLEEAMQILRWALNAVHLSHEVQRMTRRQYMVFFEPYFRLLWTSNQRGKAIRNAASLLAGDPQFIPAFIQAIPSLDRGRQAFAMMLERPLSEFPHVLRHVSRAIWRRLVSGR